MVVASFLLTSEFLQEPRGNFRQDGAQLVLLGYHDASKSRFLRCDVQNDKNRAVFLSTSWLPNLLPHEVVIPNGALCREESACPRLCARCQQKQIPPLSVRNDKARRDFHATHGVATVT